MSACRPVSVVLCDWPSLSVTCHRGRYQALAEADKPLYAERVQWLDLAAARPAATRN